MKQLWLGLCFWCLGVMPMPVWAEETCSLSDDALMALQPHIPALSTQHHQLECEPEIVDLPPETASVVTDKRFSSQYLKVRIQDVGASAATFKVLYEAADSNSETREAKPEKKVLAESVTLYVMLKISDGKFIPVMQSQLYPLTTNFVESRVIAASDAALRIQSQWDFVFVADTPHQQPRFRILQASMPMVPMAH